MSEYKYIRRFADLGIQDVPLVGGKNASLGEMYRELSSQGVKVPNGFATTAQAYRYFLEYNGLRDRIGDALGKLDVNDVDALAHTGSDIRSWIVDGNMPPDLAEEITAAYKDLAHEAGHIPDVAVRSSATAEDLPDASFADRPASRRPT